MCQMMLNWEIKNLVFLFSLNVYPKYPKLHTNGHSLDPAYKNNLYEFEVVLSTSCAAEMFLSRLLSMLLLRLKSA